MILDPEHAVDPKWNLDSPEPVFATPRRSFASERKFGSPAMLKRLILAALVAVSFGGGILASAMPAAAEEIAFEYGGLIVQYSIQDGDDGSVEDDWGF
jgi:hypothetical protein